MFDIPGPRADLIHIHASAEEFGRLYQARLSIHATPIAFAAALDALSPRAPIRWEGQARGREQGVHRLDGSCDAAAGRGQSRRDHGMAARQCSARYDPLQRRRQLCLVDSSLLSVPALRKPYRADLRLDGLWRAGGGGDAAAASREPGVVDQRRRRFSDERSGIRDRGSI